MRNDGHLAVVALLLLPGEPPDEALIRGEGALDERRVHPELKFGVGSRVARARREAAQPAQRLAADMLVDGLHRLPGAIGLLLRAVRDQVERAERADQPAPEVVPEIGVLDDARRDERMRDLKQHRRPAAEERGQRRVADSPDRALGREVPVAASEPVGVRAPCGCSRSTSPHAHTVPFSASLGEMQGAQLRTTELGSTGLEITRVGLGAWAIGGGGFEWSWGAQEDEESVAAIHRALELGVNWIDTAAQYGFGHSEEVVGQAIAGLDERPFIFTKGGQPQGPGGATLHDLTRDGLRRELEGSLSRLGLEAVDLYQIHWPIPDEQIEEGWAALVELRDEGLTRHIGVSNFSVEQLRRVQAIAPVETLQPPYSLIAREVEDEILPFAEREGIGVIVYSPMGSGLLSGSMTRERIDALPDDDWRRRSPEFRDPRLAGAPGPGRAPSGRGRAPRHDPGCGRRRLDAPQSSRRRSNRRLPPAGPGRPDRRRGRISSSTTTTSRRSKAQRESSAAEQLRLADRPDVPVGRVDLAVVRTDQRRELAAVRGRGHRVGRTAHDGGLDRIRAKLLELGPKVELVHEAAEPQRAPGREPRPGRPNVPPGRAGSGRSRPAVPMCPGSTGSAS